MSGVIISGLLIFLFSFSVHVVLWRLGPPKAKIRALFIVFIILPLPFLLVSPFTAEEALAVYLLCYSLSAAYIASYPAVEAVSPTIALTLKLGRAGKEGLSKKNISEMFSDNDLLAPRINDLTGSGLAVEYGGFLKTTPNGEALVRLFIVFRKALGLREGRG